MSKPQLLGILGGLGPEASSYFYQLIINKTKVTCDQDHIDIIINSRASTPDRTEFIIGNSTKDPFKVMIEDSKKLVDFGADVLVIPCNTAHFFYKELDKNIDVPFINMIEETVKECKAECDKVGILATTGTIMTDTYQSICENYNLDYEIPSDENQKVIMNIIYDEVKKGKSPDMVSFYNVVDSLKKMGCTKIILGCTELSLIKRDNKLSSDYIDSMEVLADRVIEIFGREKNN